MRDIRTPALAKESGVPYGTLRRILELNSVADYEQLRRIAEALRMPLSEIVEDAENLAEDPDVIADYHEETSSDVPSTDATSADVDTTPADEANAALADTDNGIDIDAWADRIKAEDAVSEEKK